jgi:hypothetical protein
MARIYQRGKVLWGKWRQEGKVIRQSLSTRDEAEAKRVLKERMSHGTSTGDGAGCGERRAVGECSSTTSGERLRGRWFAWECPKRSSCR